MSISPAMKQTIDEVSAKLRAAINARSGADKQVGEWSEALRALLNVVEDDKYKADYLGLLDEATGKAGFREMIRIVLALRPNGLTAPQIKTMIQETGRMDLSNYSNPLASIHTTLRRMVESGEIVSTVISGERTFRLKELSAAPVRRFRKL
jgi:hypothetical protein